MAPSGTARAFRAALLLLAVSACLAAPLYVTARCSFRNVVVDGRFGAGRERESSQRLCGAWPRSWKGCVSLRPLVLRCSRRDPGGRCTP
jgi:hypothetical protein